MLLGDINFDDTVDLIDCVLLIKDVSGTITLSSTARQAADVNLDSYVDAEDALILVKFIVKLYDILPVTS